MSLNIHSFIPAFYTHTQIHTYRNIQLFLVFFFSFFPLGFSQYFNACYIYMLYLLFREITDINMLNSFIHLRYIDISKNSLKDLSPLSNLTHMLTLKADENLLTSAKLEEMPFLQTASFNHNRINTTEGINHPSLEILSLNCKYSGCKTVRIFIVCFVRSEFFIVCLYVYLCVCVCVCVCVCERERERVYIYMCVCMYMCVCVYIYIYILCVCVKQ